MLRHVEARAGDWLKGLRARMKLSQRGLAEAIGVHYVSVARWETGESRISGRYRTLLNDLARVHNYPPLAPQRKKGKRPVVVLHLPDGWVEKEDREVRHNRPDTDSGGSS